MIKVAIIIDTWFPLVGGGQVSVYEISKRIAKRNVYIDILTRDNGYYNLQLPSNLKVIKLGRYSEPYDLLSKIIFLFRAYYFILKNNYDVIHANAFLPGITAKALQFTKNVPIVFTVHGTSLGTALNNFFQRYVEKFILTSITYNVQITVSRDFIKIRNRNKHIVYIPNGVDLTLFDKVSVKKLQNPTLLFVGRLHEQKNLPNLLKAFSVTKNYMPNVKLIIVGKGPQKEMLKKLIIKLKLAKSIQLRGELMKIDLIKLYKSVHIFILPSIYEGQPITLLEAWAAKLPVVVSNAGDCQYLVKKGINGYLINNPNDPKEIFKAIKKAVQNKHLSKLGENGYSLVAKSFSWDITASRTLGVYESLIKTKN